jgi:hypothetical protein
MVCWLSDPTVLNSVLWTDSPNEIHQNGGSPTFAYCNIEGGWPGTGNLGDRLAHDPLFVDGPLHAYYLSHIAAGQGVDSPCVDAGYGTAADYGMERLTTRTDGAPDVSTVDMGYHAESYLLRILEVGRNDGDLTVRWNGRGGINYVVRMCTTFSNWWELSVGDVTQWTDAFTGPYEVKFYAVRAE